MIRIPAWLGWLTLGCSGVIWVAMIPVPIFALFQTLFGSVGSLSKLVDPVVLSTLWVTLLQALVSTALSVVVGVPLGLWLGRLRAEGRGVKWTAAARLFLSVPYSVPTLVAATAWVAWLGRSGVLAKAGLPIDVFAVVYTWKAVILAHVFFNAPWIALQVADSRAYLPGSLLEAAQTMGAGFRQLQSKVVWPHVRFALMSASVQVFALCVMSFALVLLLGGGPPVETLETVLYSRIRYGSLDVEGAAACALWQLVLTLVPWSLLIVFAKNRIKGVQGTPLRRPQPAGWEVVLVAVLALGFVLPYFVTFLNSNPLATFMRPEFHVEIAGPLLISLEIAVASAFGAVALALAAVIVWIFLKQNTRVASLYLAAMGAPSGISVLVLGLGGWMAYSRWIDPFEGSLVAMMVLQIMIFYPIALRLLLPLAEKIPVSLIDAAETLGASPLHAIFLIEWPRWRGPVFVAFGVVAGASLGEVAAVSLFYSEQMFPLPLLLARWMGQYRFEDAQALAAVLFSLCAGMTVAVAMLGGEHGAQSIGERDA